MAKTTTKKKEETKIVRTIDQLSLGRMIAQKYGLIPQRLSKFRRALDLAKGE